MFIRKRHDLCAADLPTITSAFTSGVSVHPPEDALMALSIRSGFDLCLSALAWPKGSEVLVSAITITGMIRILEHHGLVPVPIDLDARTMAPKLTGGAVTKRTKAILVAHLFGGRFEMEGIIDFANTHKLLLFEDCAQCFDGQLNGHEASDVQMYSFGPIKTATALGGGLLRLKDSALLDSLRRLQSGYPFQTKRAYLMRWLKTCALESIASPRVYGGLVKLAKHLSIDHDYLLNQAVRSFTGEGFIQALRRRPSRPLQRLLDARLRGYNTGRIKSRIEAASAVERMLHGVERPGAASQDHTHWLYPVLSKDPPGLVKVLRAQNFDATLGSSLAVVEAPESRARATEAERIMRSIVYAPVYPEIPKAKLETMGALISEHNAVRGPKA